VGFVPYSPLGRGFLTGQINRYEDFETGDYRRNSPRFQGENFQKNLDLVARLQDMATARRCTPPQLALAWVLAQGNDLAPIPGTKRRDRLDENLRALDLTLSPGELQELNGLFPPGAASGARYPESMMHMVNR
jgi:aryl-alcohol dehydrogenase-like predicted oxidoreductase